MMDSAQFTSEALDLLDETFENHHGIYTDKGTSLLETLATLTAAQASIPVGGRKGHSIAAQVAHFTLYLDVLERFMRGEDIGTVDWEDIWKRVGAVSPEEWEGMKARLEQTYRRVLATVRGFEEWETEPRMSGVLAILAHTAYHLGDIRQALCVVQGADAG